MAEEPNRLDLEALLSSIYLKLEQRVEAAESALAVLKKLPNCLTANQVMAEVLTVTDRKGEMEEYRNRIAEIDPYFRFISTKYPEASSVPEQLVKIERLEWNPSPDNKVNLAEEPSYTSFIFDDDKTLSSAEENSNLNLSEDQAAPPEWLMNTDLRAAGEELDRNTTSPEENLIFSSDSEVEKKGIQYPDWLQEFEQPSDPKETFESEDDAPWLGVVQSTELSENGEGTESPASVPFLPVWLLDFDDEASQGEPDEIVDEASQLPTIDNDQSFNLHVEDEPEILAVEKEKSIGETETNDWLQSLQQDFSVSSEDSEPFEVQVDQMEDAQDGKIHPPEKLQDLGDIVPLESEDESPAWIQDNLGKPEELVIEDGSIKTNQSPDLGNWTLDFEKLAEGARTKSGAFTDTPDWLDAEGPSEEAGPIDFSPADHAGYMPAWLIDFRSLFIR